MKLLVLVALVGACEDTVYVRDERGRLTQRGLLHRGRLLHGRINVKAR